MNKIPMAQLAVQAKTLGPEWGWTVRFTPSREAPFTVNFHKPLHFFPAAASTLEAAAAESFRRALLWQKEGVK